MNSEEPVESAQQNDQISTQGHDLPEQGKVGRSTMPRQVSVLDWIHQWQPMGYRVVVNLPFTGDDSSYLFAIRNGPFIPRWEKWYTPRNRDTIPVTGKCNGAAGCVYQTPFYAWNNTRAVFPLDTSGTNRGKSIVVTQYDAPPLLSTLAQSFRRWRGDMQYRIRLVAGFVTQGYLIVTSLKNKFLPIGKYNEYWFPVQLTTQDLSYREGMQNAYVLSDTSMIRHAEVTMQYEYPLPYYDQYEWLARRVNPYPYMCRSHPGSVEVCKTVRVGPRFDQLPHGDNFLVVGLRGQIASGQAGSQLAFELEYRAVEGFQFADPGFPPTDTSYSFNNMIKAVRANSNEVYKKYMQVKSVPSESVDSNGWATLRESSKELREQEWKALSAGIQSVSGLRKQKVSYPQEQQRTVSTTTETPFTSRYIDEEGRIRSIPAVRSEQLKAANGSQQQRSNAQASRQAYSRHRTHRDTDGVENDHENGQEDTPERVTSWLGSSSRY